MKRKVGILTLPLIDNYGGIIQLCALYKAVESIGYEPHIIIKKRDVSVFKRLKYKLVEENPLFPFVKGNKFTKNSIKLQQIDTFLKKFFKHATPVLRSQSELKKYGTCFDAYIVGSDQVWRKEYTKDNYANYFLDFVPKNKIKLSYAASFGTHEWEGSQESIEVVNSLLDEFNQVSVREKCGVEVLHDTFGYTQGQHVLDPTLLFDKGFYDEIIASEGKENAEESQGVFNYVLDRNSKYNNRITGLCEQQNLTLDVLELDAAESEDIAGWLTHFKNAKYIITDSFHGMVFSIIYKKRFIAIGNKKRGMERFTSLLEVLGLSSRLVEKASQINFELLNQPIDYQLVDQRLAEQKSLSINFLKEHLVDTSK